MAPQPERRHVKRKLRTALAVVAGVAVLAVGGFLVWFYAIKKDAPTAFDESSLDSVLGATTTTDPGAPVTTTAGTDPTATTSAAGTVTTGDAPSADDISGTWTASTDSQVGYRVKETLAGLDTEAAGRTDSITAPFT